MKGISVIICCYNSGNKLIPTLNYLAQKQVLPHVNYEIIIVDNNCTDNTIEIASETWLSFGNPFPLSVIKQQISGLNYARKMGVATALYDYIIFCDDDNWLCKDYLYKVYHLFEAMPEVGLIGGVGEAVCETPAPEWFNELKGFGYAVGTENRQTGYVNSIYGAGMAIRKSVFQQITKHNLSFRLSDRRMDAIFSGGDTEISILVLLKGYKIFLDTTLIFKHFLPTQRLTWKYYLKLRRSFGQAQAYLNFYQELSFNTVLNYKMNKMKKLIGLLKLIVRNFPHSFFPNFFKDEGTANLVQEIHMQKTLIMEGTKLTDIADNSNKFSPEDIIKN